MRYEIDIKPKETLKIQKIFVNQITGGYGYFCITKSSPGGYLRGPKMERTSQDHQIKKSGVKIKIFVAIS